MKQLIRAVVSGSFHRHMSEVADAVQEFCAHGVIVLSPSDPRIVEAIGEFLFVASDLHRSIRLVQDRHLASICAADFLWLVSPDGYVGQSASLEIGFAVARGIPVYGSHLPGDLTLRQYVRGVDDITEVVRLAKTSASTYRPEPSLLVAPVEAVSEMHSELENLRDLLCTVSKDDIAEQVAIGRSKIRRILGGEGD
jgi:hypothetical protein